MLRVNLTDGSITKISTDPYKEFVGGMGIGYKVLWDEVPLDTHPYAPEAKAIVAVGPLTASGIPCGGRTNFSFLTNMSKGKSVCDGHMGGHFAQYLKYAGYDAIIFEGRSTRPVYLKIDDEEVTLESAEHLWGLGTFDTNKSVIEACGPEFSSFAIGPAGENLVNYSIVHSSQGNAGGAGIGAVLGSKHLKAVVARGTGSVKIADPEEMMRLNNYQLSELIGANNNHNCPTHPQSWAEFTAQPANRWRGAPGHHWGRAPGGPVDTGEQPYWDINKIGYRMFKGIQDFSLARNPMQYTVKYGGCSFCPTRCYAKYDYHPLVAIGENPKYTQTCVSNTFGANNWYLGNAPDIAEDGDAPMLIGAVCGKWGDDLGLWENYGMLPREFRFCYENGVFERVLPAAEYNEIPWDWMLNSDPRWGPEIIRRIALRQGEISRLGEGAYNYAEDWGLTRDTEVGREFWDGLFMNQITYNGYPQHHSTEGWQSGLIYNVMYNRDCMVHTLTNFLRCGMPIENIQRVGDNYWGPGAIDPPNDFTRINDSKIRFAKFAFLRKQWHDMSTLCDWMWPMHTSPSRDRGYQGDIDLEAKFMTAITGEQWTTDDVHFACEKVSNMMRVMTAISFHNYYGSTNLREDHDQLNDHWFDRHPDIPVFTEGTNKMDRDDMELTKDMFYAAMGWDKDTGIPTRSTLVTFGLGDMANELQRRGLLPAENGVSLTSCMNPDFRPLHQLRV
jgi:aldehyde:ferredoxin oxidoreductase